MSRRLRPWAPHRRLTTARRPLTLQAGRATILRRMATRLGVPRASPRLRRARRADRCCSLSSSSCLSVGGTPSPQDLRCPQRTRQGVGDVRFSARVCALHPPNAGPLLLCRLQGLVIGLQSELEELRAQFSSTVEQARVDGVRCVQSRRVTGASLRCATSHFTRQGELAAAEVGGFYEDGEEDALFCGDTV